MSNLDKKLTYSEAGYLGYLASKEKCQEAKRLRHEEYAKNPNRCVNCGKVLPWEKKSNKFCNHKCAAEFNNRGRTFDEIECVCCGKKFSAKSKNKKFCSEKCQIIYVSFQKYMNDKNVKIELEDFMKTLDEDKLRSIGKCLNCGKNLKRKQTTYCSFECQKEYSWKIKKELIEKVGEFSCIKDGLTKDETNRREVKRYLTEKHGHKCSICGLTEWMGQPIPLVVDHIDGNPTNHAITNFRLVCGNCDMQLPTYKAKNKGNGRKYRRTDNQ